MKLSSKTRYSLRILLQIAVDGGKEQAVKGRIIAEKQLISEAYLEQIMIPLKASGLVNTIRGCRGGYSLGKPPEAVSVLDIIELFEGKIEFAACSGSNLEKKCELLDNCMASEIWNKLSNALETAASQISLASIIETYTNRNVEEYII